MTTWDTFLMAISCAFVALSQRRNPILWFLLGLLWNVYALAILLFLTLLRFMIAKAIIRRIRPKPSQAEVTIDVIPERDLDPGPQGMEKLWYMLDKKNETIGPMSFTLLCKKWKEGAIAEQTLIWNETFSEWKPFQEVFPSK